MKITVGSHPDLPFPFSNGPEFPPAPQRGLLFAPMLIARDLELGSHWGSELVRFWLNRSGRSVRQFEAMANWAMGERAAWNSSAINRVTNRKQGIGLSALVAMEALNSAIHLWHTEGPEEAWGRVGPPGAWDVRPEWLDASIWLPHPEDELKPLDLHDFVDVLVGRLELPYLGPGLLLPADHIRLADHLAALLDRTIEASGQNPLAAVRRLLLAYPINDVGRKDRFRDVLLGQAELTSDELAEELLAIAESIRSLRGLAPGSYGPAELRAELLALAKPPR